MAALAFIAADPERLGAFLSVTGLDGGAIREEAGKPGFLVAVMDHLMADESLLLAFAAEAGLDPAAVGEAGRRLGGPAPGPGEFA